MTEPRAWNSGRAALCGALVGIVAAMVKVFGPWAEPYAAAAIVREVVGAGLAFALLSAGAAILRNGIARRFIWRDGSGRAGR